MPVEVIHHEQAVSNRVKSRMMIALRLIGEDVKQESTFKTPKLHGYLRDNCRVVPTSGKMETQIIWSEPYAQYQERGMRYDGSHIVKHYTTPGTGKEFAKNAVKKVVTAERLANYMKRISQPTIVVHRPLKTPEFSSVGSFSTDGK